MDLTTPQIALLVLAWAAFGLIHSLLASLDVKRRVAVIWPESPRYYRLTFNAIALVLLTPPLYLAYLWRGEPLWQWSGAGLWMANSLAVLAVLGFVRTLRDYDTAEFIGTRQWRGHERHIEDQETLHISALHRYVRHPWYFFGLIILWTRPMDTAFLVSALCVTAYFAVGSRYEDRKLLRYHGEVYRTYMHRVPGLIPIPGRSLSREEAGILTKKYRDAVYPGTE